MHLSAYSAGGNGSWAQPVTARVGFAGFGGGIGLSGDLLPLSLPTADGDELGWNDSWPRRHYWHALLLLSVGLSLLLGALVFLVSALTLRTGRCSPGTAGAAAATLSSLVLVALLVCTRAVDTPKYE